MHSRHENSYTLYEKKGRRYYPVKEYDSKVHDSFPAGFSLVQTNPGSTSIRYVVEPAVIQVIAALKLLEDGMLQAVRTAAEYRPEPAPVTEKTRDLWKALEAELEKEGRDGRMLRLWGCSAYDLVKAGTDYLLQYLKEHPNDGHNSTVGSQGI